MNRTLISLLAVVGALLLAPSVAEASHLRFGHLTWERSAPGSRTITMTGHVGWRSGTSGGISVNWGDGTSSYVGGTIVASGTDRAGEQFQIRRYIVTKTYANDGPYTLSYQICCRISTLVNARDRTFRLESSVDLRNPNNMGSPVSSIPIILQLPQGGARTFVLPISDPDGRPFTCRLATNAEAGWGTSPHPTAGGHALSVSQGCMISWNTSGTAVNQKYATQIVIESIDTPTADATKVALDFIIEITSPGGAPTCSGSTGTQTALVGVPMSASFTGTDPNGGSLVVNHMGLPPGASLSPSPGSSGAVPFTSTLNWTPTMADAGKSYAVLITYTDPTGLQGYCSTSIKVDDKQLGVSVTSNGPVRQVIDAWDTASQTVTFPLTIANTGVGDATDSYTVSVGGGLPGWTGSITPITISNLQPGQSVPATVTITAPANLDPALDVPFTVTATSTTNSVIKSTLTITPYTNPPPPVVGLATTSTLLSGNNATLTTRLQPTTLSARVTESGNVVTGPGVGVMMFYVAGVAVGGDTDSNGDGVFSIQWTPGFSWNLYGPQQFRAVYSGIDFASGNDLLGSSVNGTITIAQSIDTDGDGLSDEFENYIGTNPNAADSDGDGLSDGNENTRGTDPLSGDTDGDGISDGQEISLGTSPVAADSDGDGFSDGDELTAGTNPTDATSSPLPPPNLVLTSPGAVFNCSPDSAAADATTCTVVISGHTGAACTVAVYRDGILIGTFNTQSAFSMTASAELGISAFTVIATNQAGTSSGNFAVQVIPNAATTLLAPDAVINATQASLTWDFQTAPGVSMNVTQNGVAQPGVTADSTGLASITLAAPADGIWTYSFCPQSQSGTVPGPCYTQTLTVDATPPVLSCPAPVNGPWTTSATTLVLSADDSSSHLSPNPLAIDWQVVAEDGTVWTLSNTDTYSQVFAPGFYTATVVVTDAAGNTSSCSSTVQVDRHVTACDIPSATTPFGGTISVAGSLTDATDSTSMSGTLSYTLNGAPIATLVDYRVLLPMGTHTMGVSYSGDSLYHPCQASSTLTVTATGGKVTGGGFHGSNTWGFNAMTKKGAGQSATPSGNVNFQNAAEGISFSGTTITGIGAARPYAVVMGTGSLNGQTGYSFTMTVEDNKEPGVGNDRFRIEISGPNGFSFDSGSELLQGGNIQLH